MCQLNVAAHFRKFFLQHFATNVLVLFTANNSNSLLTPSTSIAALPVHKSPSVRTEVFAALEADDTTRLNSILASINSFNKKTLRRTITRDRSSPMLNISALNEARDALRNETVEATFSENGDGAMMFCASSDDWKLQANSRLSIDKGVEAKLSDDVAVSDESSQNANQVKADPQDPDSSTQADESLSTSEQILFELSLDDPPSQRLVTAVEERNPTNSTQNSPTPDTEVVLIGSERSEDDLHATANAGFNYCENTHVQTNPDENRGDNGETGDDVKSSHRGDNPECDLHLTADHQPEREAAEAEHYFEQSGTESADEH